MISFDAEDHAIAECFVELRNVKVPKTGLFFKKQIRVVNHTPYCLILSPHLITRQRKSNALKKLMYTASICPRRRRPDNFSSLKQQQFQASLTIHQNGTIQVLQHQDKKSPKQQIC